MNNLFHKILTDPLLSEKPPVLIDVGASGELHSAWKLIAKYSVCVAFDADTRDFQVSEQNDRGYKKLYMINRIVGTESIDDMEFYLTRSPYCSSALEPDSEALKPWAFNNLFIKTKTVKMPAVTLSDTLGQCGLNYIDWYKTDSQGTDLRLFDSLSDDIKRNTLSAEFEPGIIDAYKHEDKLHNLMSFMENYPFWVTSMDIKGSQRIPTEDLEHLGKLRKKFVSYLLKTSPGWCEIVYLNDFDEIYSERDFLLGWIIASIKNEFGFAAKIARKGLSATDNPLFKEMLKSSKNSLIKNLSYAKISTQVFRKLVRKIL